MALGSRPDFSSHALTQWNAKYGTDSKILTKTLSVDAVNDKPLVLQWVEVYGIESVPSPGHLESASREVGVEDAEHDVVLC
jgi:hypothetical protein